MCRIDKLMSVFCKSKCVTYKRYVFSCKIDKKFVRINVIAKTIKGKKMKKKNSTFFFFLG